ncbi:hypothetical protein BOTBODRAFT_173766 [Botryobasidium botryosum FD-172 SS1]|uniref:Protein kinase domain-containing protein n=1 Tax=Botryobasidium botryosum (strain FD-172 SS1) TaxID=930990 RepID=A0A067MUX9_BOTB1|nr:hypothetical protein BOTBODRAFT_173766 [Botryobasidium botryosum FD-172 SS1]
MATDRWATDQDDEGADKALERLSSHHIHPVLLDFLEDVDTAEGGYGVVRRARLHHVDVPLDDKVTFKLITQDEKHYVVPAERPKLEKLVSTFFPQYKQHLVTHSEDVAVKGLMFFSHVALSRMKRRFVREILVWLQFDHPNVLPLLGFHLDFRQSIAWFVSPWGTYGSISDYVAKKDPKISSDEVLRLLEGTAKGLAYLHNHNPTVCHGDIKAANVLVGSKRQALLCDFGLATMVDGESAGLQTSYSFKGSIRWCSRELLDTGQRTGSSDIWAWGFLVYEVITGKVPFQDVPGQVAVMRRILDGELPTAKETPEFDGAAPLWDLVQWCWSAEPGDRPTINECLLTLQPLLKARHS